ncbi:MAG: ribosome maturation factor RimP [Thermoanaerobaculales bacterium]|jgi:ribosome maturation factor RimP|nr:ribosome maturation factor RimP [Thermoanaerobaculales bacterium]
MKLSRQTIDELAAIAADEGLELLATEVVGSGPRTVLRLVVDSPAGVTLDQCTAVSRQASALLDVEEPIRHRYTLEVSSPGLDRKLYSAGDYERFAGRRVRVKMQPGYRDQRLVVGELVGLAGEIVRVVDDRAGAVELPLGEVFETRIEVDWDAIMKEGKNRQ